jgi:hypothetical protein
MAENVWKVIYGSLAELDALLNEAAEDYEPQSWQTVLSNDVAGIVMLLISKRELAKRAMQMQRAMQPPGQIWPGRG